METTVLSLILLVEVAVVAEEECKKFQKISRQKSPAIDNYHIGFHEMDKNKKKIILKQLYLKIIHVNTLSYVIYYTIDFKNTVLCTYNYDF